MTQTDEFKDFDPTEQLKEGITVLEASAGTGKTHAVASIVVAEVAEGRRLDELLVVTFTRKATGTLRERVWIRLIEAAQALAPQAPTPSDQLLAHLRRGTSGEVALRRLRIQRALSDFDAATITTTHGFCQQVLASLGVAGDAERNLELVESVGALVTDAVDDLFVRRFHAGQDVLFDRATAVAIARAVVGKPDCTIGPTDDNETDRLRRRFALSLRDRINAQKRRGRIITFDDLLSRLDVSMADDKRGTIVAERLRRRYSMAIVDEFQDTDTVQWRILRTAFGTAPSRLVLVGDPKQAIYAFRGGDVYAYLEATRSAQHRRNLPISWRADQPLLDAQDSLFAGAQFGDEAIRHRSVRARPGAESCALTGPAVGAPLTVRIAQRSSGSLVLTKTGLATKASARDFICDDLAAEAVRILQSATMVEGRELAPRDIAVLTRTHSMAEAARAALQSAGVPAVVHGGTSVLTTDAARDWLDLLRALEQPASGTRVHAVARGPFVGWNATRIATANDAEWDEVDGALHEWAAVLQTRGVAGLLRRIDAGSGLTARLLGTVGGERHLSDLRHIAELLHAQHAARSGSVAVLAAWLVDQTADVEQGGDDARRRLESDADAVAIHTVHGAKGLEFPIVLLPSMWEAPWTDPNEIPMFHAADGVRSIGVGGNGSVHDQQVELAARELDEETLRLLYVSMTRAKHRVVVWWATTMDADRSAFARLLCGHDQATGAVLRRLQRKPDEPTIAAKVTACGIAVEDATGSTGQRYQQAPPTGDILDAARFDRTFDRHWVRTSYSGLTRAAHEAGPSRNHGAVEVEEVAKVDEPVVSVEPRSSSPAFGVPLPLGGIPGGARVGTLIHEVLEQVDFAAPDLPTALGLACSAVGARRILEGHVDSLVAGLTLTIETPLGPKWDGTRLRDIRQADRLDELNFDMPLAGGNDPGSTMVTMDAIADVFAGLPADDPLASYHVRLRDPLIGAAVRGFLTGSIDLVARFGERHIVVDYKSNVLAPGGEPLTTWHYRPEALAEAMQDAHYPLQAALYLVGLHRFLRWRLAGYEPDRHLGGVAYLFLRGMVGAGVPLLDGEPCGVFTWQPPAQFVTALSDVLDRGAP